MNVQELPWFKNAIFYEVYVRAYRDSNADGHGDLRGLLEKLDYIQDLGVDCIWLLPIFPSPLLDDGYDIADYYNVHPDFGDLNDFKTLLDEAHARGLRVITDLVVNHTSDKHPWFQAARANRNSPYRNYYVWSDTDEKYQEARIIFLDTEKSNWTWDEVAGQYFWHRFYSSQPDLNYDNPAVQEEMLNIMKFWLDLGVDGFRSDAVPYLYERPGTNCENLPETHAYLKRMRRFMDDNYPGRILLCEANQWPKDVIEYFGDDDEFHMAFHFPVMPRIYMSLAMGDRTPLVDILNATPPISQNNQWATFLRNHDELTLEMVSPEERQFMWDYYAPEARMRLNLGIRRRLAPLLGGDRMKIELLNSILFTLPGSPIIYYGDEIGMGDTIWLDDRDGVRTPMQWDAGPGAGFSEASPDRFYAPLIDDEHYHPKRVQVAAQRSDPRSLWHTIRRMIYVRKENAVFSSGSFSILPVENNGIYAVQRELDGESLIALHNLTGVAQSFLFAPPGWVDKEVIDILSCRSLYRMGEEACPLTLGAYDYLWLKAAT
jgi:maltose alpha-D-glucosyltransferase / alpha-amylase